MLDSMTKVLGYGMLTFTTNTFPQRPGICNLVGVILLGYQRYVEHSGVDFPNLEVVDVNVEPAASVFG